MEITIESDISECTSLIDELGYESKCIQRDMLKAIGQKCRTKAKSHYRKQRFARNTGKLYGSINYGLNKSKDTLFISANARGLDKVRYGYVLAAGHRKVMKKNDYGRWVDSGQQVRFRRVYDIIEEPVDKYLGSAEYRKDLDSALQKKIDKIERKLGVR